MGVLTSSVEPELNTLALWPSELRVDKSVCVVVWLEGGGELRVCVCVSVFLTITATRPYRFSWNLESMYFGTNLEWPMSEF